MRWQIPLFSVVLFVVACGGDDAVEGEDGGEPPRISGLTYDPATIPVGSPTTITGTLTFEDPDGDVARFGLAVTPPGGESQELPKVDIANAQGVKRSPTQVAFFVQPQVPGPHEFEVYVVDAEGHESNRLAGRLAAE